MRLIDADHVINRVLMFEEITGEKLDQVHDFISSEPTIEPQKWIPVKEMLPKYGQVVLWCNEHGSVFTSAITVRVGNSWAIGKRHRRSKVIAWMPLPDPYTED